MQPGRFCDPQHHISSHLQLRKPIGCNTIGQLSSAFHHPIFLPGDPVSAEEAWQDVQQDLVMNGANVD